MYSSAYKLTYPHIQTICNMFTFFLNEWLHKTFLLFSKNNVLH